MKIPDRPPDMRQLMASLPNGDRVADLLNMGLGPAPDGKYRHWDTVRRMKPPEGLTPEEFWLAQKASRVGMKREIEAFSDTEGRPFWYCLPDPLLRYLHDVDRLAAGTLRAPNLLSQDTGQRFIQMSVVEEAITSSQLEGAATTRKVAKEMIRSGRKPQTTGERMILNNYRAMLAVRDLAHEPLSIELIEYLHGMLTEGTAPQRVTYRSPNDGIGVYDNATNTLLHRPPPADESANRLSAMCAFANADAHAHFLHPAVKAIILHFWFAWIHPFEDGNGRTARTLFYWYLLKNDFWIAEYVSISRILKKAPARYGKSFLYTETDENDLTYFILAQMKVLLRSVEELFDYVLAKTEEVRAVSQLLTPSSGFNHRQLALLSHALRNTSASYTIESHKNSHGVTYQTARTDLLSLADEGLLNKQTRGRTFVFVPAKDLAEVVRKRGMT
ncbi:MAG: Fic family protein [Candidatus Paceibacterota bacterium]